MEESLFSDSLMAMIEDMKVYILPPIREWEREESELHDIWWIKTEDKTWKFSTHQAHNCVSPCPLHKPTDHHMLDWPVNIRRDRNFMIERICEHGVGHPDPDGVPFHEMLHEDSGDHGCDGCCMR